MKQDLSKDLFILVAVLLIGFSGYCAYWLNDQYRKVGEVKSELDIGLDSDLTAIVAQLENDLKERYALEYTSTKNPLKMSRVITYVSPLLAEKEEEREREEARKKRERETTVQGFSLSATIVANATRSAVIRYNNKSHIVKEGDTIEGRKVVQIERERVVLRNPGGQDLVLLPKSAANARK